MKKHERIILEMESDGDIPHDIARDAIRFGLSWKKALKQAKNKTKGKPNERKRRL